MTNVIERLGKYAGLDFDKQRTPSNPCITVREAIEVANHIATLTSKLAEAEIIIRDAALTKLLQQEQLAEAQQKIELLETTLAAVDICIRAARSAE